MANTFPLTLNNSKLHQMNKSVVVSRQRILGGRLATYHLNTFDVAQHGMIAGIDECDALLRRERAVRGRGEGRIRPTRAHRTRLYRVLATASVEPIITSHKYYILLAH